MDIEILMDHHHHHHQHNNNNGGGDDDDDDGLKNKIEEDPQEEKNCFSRLDFVLTRQFQEYSQFRGITNHMDRKIPFNASRQFRFSITPYGLPANILWYQNIVQLIKDNVHILVPFSKQRQATLPKDSILALASLDNQQQQQQQQNDETFVMYNQDQIDAYNIILENLQSHSFFLYALLGPAGTGKTMCLRQLAERHQVIYITLQNNLCRDAEQRLKPAHTFTLCKFLMNLLEISFYQQCELTKILIAHKFRDMSQLVSDLTYNEKFLASLFSYKRDKNHVILCFDEFSMVASNIILLIKTILKDFVDINSHLHIMMIICGDCHQIQPIFVTKAIQQQQQQQQQDHEEEDDDDNVTANVDLNQDLYPKQYQTLNCMRNVSHVDDIIYFSKQLRNSNPIYNNFLSSIIKSDTWIIDIVHYFQRTCFNHTIPFYYPCKQVLELGQLMHNYLNNNNNNVRYLQEIFAWQQETFRDFRQFAFFSWSNSDAHFVNLSVFYAAHAQYKLYCEEQMLSSSPPYYQQPQRPRLCPIYFYTGNNIYNGVYNRPRIPVLPLIVGMQYKLLINVLIPTSSVRLCRGDLLTLVHIADKFVICIVKNLMIQLYTTYFNMNLFADEKHFDYEERATLADREPTRQLYGFPLQLACADTVRSSIGITVDADIYANLMGCSIEETYVLLSRTKDEKKIKGLLLN
nr:hypothetical protein [Microctonus hyperodae filamentous virus]